MIKESDIQTKIMNMLGMHPSVAFAYVTSTGTFKGYNGGRPIKIGFPGLADIIGMMTDGRMLAIEVKKPGQKPRKEQQDFLDLVNRNGGIALCCDSPDSVDFGLSQ